LSLQAQRDNRTEALPFCKHVIAMERPRSFPFRNEVVSNIMAPLGSAEWQLLHGL